MVIETINIALRGAKIIDRELLLRMYGMIVDEDFPAKLLLIEAQENFFRVKIGQFFEIQFMDYNNWVSVYIINSRRDRNTDYDGFHFGQITSKSLMVVAQFLIQYAHDIDSKARCEKAWRQNLAAMGISIN